jgi:hypothetical protein
LETPGREAVLGELDLAGDVGKKGALLSEMDLAGEVLGRAGCWAEEKLGARCEA